MTHLTQHAFPEVRQPGDPDAVADITDILRRAGHPDPEAWQQAPVIQEAAGQAPKLQRFLINRHWRMRLGALACSTTAERFCLQDGDINHTEYLRIFEQIVAPTIVRENI